MTAVWRDDVEPLPIYGYGSDPTRAEEPDGDIFAYIDSDDPTVTPLQRLLYSPPV